MRGPATRHSNPASTADIQAHQRVLRLGLAIAAGLRCPPCRRTRAPSDRAQWKGLPRMLRAVLGPARHSDGQPAVRRVDRFPERRRSSTPRPVQRQNASHDGRTGNLSERASNLCTSPSGLRWGRGHVPLGYSRSSSNINTWERATGLVNLIAHAGVAAWL